MDSPKQNLTHCRRAAMRNPIIRNTALFLMTSAMEDHQRKLAKEIETKRLEEEKAKNEQIYGWQLGGPPLSQESQTW